MIKGLRRRTVHRVFLLLAAGLVFVGIFLGLTCNGYFEFLSLRYFTYLSNVFVAFGFLFLFVFYDGEPVRRSLFCSSFLLAISVTGLVYNFVLVPLDNKDMIFSSYYNFSNHFLSMVLALVNYFVFEKKGHMTSKHVIVGVIFPFAYWLIFISLGSLTDFYPYFFMDVPAIGWLMAFVWLGILLSGFIVLGILLLIFDRGIGKKENVVFIAFCRIYQFVFRMVSYILPWRNPKLFEGENSLNELPRYMAEQKHKHALIITDAVLFGLGITDSLTKALEENGTKYDIFTDVKPNPIIENVESALTLYKQNGCDCIVAVGGGSVIDCAKATAARIVKPRKAVRKMAGVLRILKKLPPLYVVPTTAGTGSEATLAAVITDAATHRKFAINDPALIPYCAVLDPVLTIKLPPAITAATGMDALVHALEAFIGGSNTKATIKDAEKAFRLIKQNLEKAYDDGTDITARENMLKASHYAGRAFTRAYVGNVHAMAHTLSGFYDVPHGLANAVLLPYVLEYYGKAVYKKLARVADITGITGGNAEEKSKNFIAYIKDLNKRFGIPQKFDCIKDKDLPKMIENAFKEANPLYPVPVIFSKRDFKNIFMKVK